MANFNTRRKELGKLIVVGGPGGSGVSTIAQKLAEHFNLSYVYGGKLMRDLAKKNGYASLTEFLRSALFKQKQIQFDSQIDSELIQKSSLKNVLIDSKVFAALAEKNKIPCTVKIWITADLEVRVKRTIEKKGFNANPKKVRLNLVRRYEKDRERFNKLYNIAFEKPELYNDLVVNSSKQNPEETFNFILKFLRDEGYLEKS